MPNGKVKFANILEMAGRSVKKERDFGIRGGDWELVEYVLTL